MNKIFIYIINLYFKIKRVSKNMYKGKNIFAEMMDGNMVICSPIPVKVWFCPSIMKNAIWNS